MTKTGTSAGEMPPRVRLGSEILAAIDSGAPLVALESALITHGLPAPLNFETAAEMETQIRDAGAVPATIAVIQGEIRVGLTEQELESLAGDSRALKIASRDLPYAVASGATAGTTVSATMWVARQVGIEIFATGGIGGVHYGVEESGDVSSDLTEITRTPVLVVCAGVKSILDIGRTLEHLETAAVPVYGYETDEFPAFFSGDSGHPVPHRVDGPAEAARIWRTHREIGLPGGMVLACPPPVRVEDQPALDEAITLANREAREQDVRGGDVTPFVLRRVSEVTGGASLRVNMALLRQNARIAGEVAIAFSLLEQQGTNSMIAGEEMK